MLKFSLFLFFNLQIAFVFGQTNYWQQKVDHVIDVTLNDKENTLDGFEKITYLNNSPDTLTYIWFHVWPNAYKNDKTAFTNQQLSNGNTNFYFSGKEKRGYINRLDFKVNGITAKTEDHPQHIDIIKLVLPAPLAPKQQLKITTPFHVKLPFTFSRGGYEKKAYQLTQWFPKPAVYDAKGWHPMPYLDQGEFYSEFGNYDVRITLPKTYVVAATGTLQNAEEEQRWYLNRLDTTIKPVVKRTSVKKSPAKKPINPKKKPVAKNTAVELLVELPTETKTLQFLQDSVHDFALFANKDFIVNTDTCLLASGKIINVTTYYTSAHKDQWKNSVQFCKDAVRFYAQEVGEYPYNNLSAVQGPLSAGGGMEYPTITIIAPMPSEKQLDIVLAHEIGHNWFYGMLASNERDHPWMDEGINSYYEKKYTEQKYGKQPQFEEIAFYTIAKTKKDQPIATSSEDFNYLNYGLVAYNKTAKWLHLVEEKLGADLFKITMQHYFQAWKFKHPQPDDFKKIISSALGNSSDEIFALLNRKSNLPNQRLSGFKILSPLKPKSFQEYLLEPTKNALIISPVVGYNNYDRFMIGGAVTNYKLPPSSFQFLAMPIYGTGSKKLNGIANMNYAIYPKGRFQKVDFGISSLSFSKNQHLDSNDHKVFERFTKITPSVRLTFKQGAKSTKENWIEARSYLIKEKEFSKFVIKSTNELFYVDSIATINRYVNQLTYSAADRRTLYPYDYQFQFQQGQGFYRANITGNYFFNYSKGGGASVRLFLSKFGYINKDETNSFSTFIYQPKLLGVTGEEDYTYSNYFVGRTASFGNDASVSKNNGLAAQQIMMRDGAMKLRIDQYEFLQGRSEDWVAAMNFNTTLPKNIFPIAIPLKLFLDVGTFSEAWKSDPQTSKFLYVGGLQLSLIKNIVNIYAPIIYSSDFKTYLKTLPEQNKFGKKITFSIDIHRITKQTFLGNTFSF